jgi:hypothetical protein
VQQAVAGVLKDLGQGLESSLGAVTFGDLLKTTKA